MTLRWLAEQLDRVCIELAIRRTLPVIRPQSGFARLRLAEERTQRLLTDDELFRGPQVPTHTVTQSRKTAGSRRELTISWTEPALSLEQSWFGDAQRVRQVKTNWYLRSSPRALVVLIGGWTPFARLSKSILWPVGQLDRAGYDVVIPHWSTEAGHVLNRRRHMWVSRPRQTTRQVLLARDPSRNIVEHAAATTIVGQLLKLAHELGHTSIAVWGTSLGAHLVALLATRRVPIHAGLYVLEKPLCRLSDPLRLHGRGGIVQRHAIADRLDRVYQCVSPLDRPLQVDAQDILVIGGEYDQIAPISGAKLLANHLGAPLQQIAASHVFDPHRTRRILEILQNNAHQY